MIKVLKLCQKDFPTYPNNTFRRILLNRFLLSFAVRAWFSDVKWNFSVLNAKKLKKLKKFSRFKPIEGPIKKFTFQKNFWANFFFYILKYKVWKKVGVTCVPLLSKIYIFGPQTWHFVEKPTCNFWYIWIVKLSKYLFIQ